MQNYFVNDRYKVLECMAKRQIPMNGEYIIKLSQQEIAGILGFTKTKVNSIVNDLKINGYVIQKSSHGKYILTEKALSEIRKLQDEEEVQ